MDITAESAAYTAAVTAIHDKWVPVDDDLLALTDATVKDETDTTTYVASGDETEGEDPDYEINLRTSMRNNFV